MRSPPAAAVQVARATGNPLSYFTSGWHAMDCASTGLLVACVTMWWVLVWRHALPFTIGLRFNVYADLGADAALLALADGGAGLQEMHAAFSRLQVGGQADGWVGCAAAAFGTFPDCCQALIQLAPALPGCRACRTSWRGMRR